ncbi:hypothetical protein AN618_22410 [Fervidicola ferrireducens]|uniref:Uncharacterized protein n=1 Tax=Fervidicola ferrireducens TaxID=520764 RepID=A0A140L219_9FIRM|nr:hypothetical protein [Fervidicola ferrireducens]KXG74594.1 hypothetical protein AN618_22410 [Fervidicola ferrireducens]
MSKSVFGKIILTSPVTHGALTPELVDKKNGGGRGNITLIRRIPVYDRVSRQYLDIPAISGNSVKNSTRRLYMSKIFERLGITLAAKIPLDVEYLFFAGGLTTNKQPEPPSQDVYLTLRRDLPFFDLLGGSYKGHYFSSQMIVGFVVPALQETIHLYPELAAFLNDDEILATSTLTGAIRNNLLGYNKVALEGTRGEIGQNNGDDETKEKGGTIYFTEAIPAGTVMMHKFSLRSGVSALTEAAFYAFLQVFLEEGKLGGGISKGHGDFKAVYYENNHELDMSEIGRRAKPFWDYIENEKEKVIARIKGIPELLQEKDKKNNGKKSKKDKEKDNSQEGDA